MASHDVKNREVRNMEELKEFFNKLDFFSLLADKTEVGRSSLPAESETVEKIKYRKEIPIVLLGKEMKLLLLEEDDIITKVDGSVFVEKSFNFSLKSKNTLLLEGFLEFVENFSTNFDYAVHGRIQRNKSSDIEGSMKDSGISFYEKMLDFINSFVQNECDEDGKGFVVMDKALMDKDIKVEDWLKKFEPILISRSYKPTNEKKTEWEKVYTSEEN